MNRARFAEGCVSGTGWRRLLQFDASVHNLGAQALGIGDLDYRTRVARDVAAAASGASVLRRIGEHPMQKLLRIQAVSVDVILPVDSEVFVN